MVTFDSAAGYEEEENLMADDEALVLVPKTRHTKHHGIEGDDNSGSSSSSSVSEQSEPDTEKEEERNPELLREILIVDDQSYNIKALEIILRTRFGLDVDNICQRAFHGK